MMKTSIPESLWVRDPDTGELLYPAPGGGGGGGGGGIGTILGAIAGVALAAPTGGLSLAFVTSAAGLGAAALGGMVGVAAGGMIAPPPKPSLPPMPAAPQFAPVPQASTYTGFSGPAGPGQGPEEAAMISKRKRRVAARTQTQYAGAQMGLLSSQDVSKKTLLGA